MLHTIIAIALGTFLGYALFTVAVFALIMRPQFVKWYTKKCQPAVNAAIEAACDEADL